MPELFRRAAGSLTRRERLVAVLSWILGPPAAARPSDRPSVRPGQELESV
jgi:hypothetical protein